MRVSRSEDRDFRGKNSEGQVCECFQWFHDYSLISCWMRHTSSVCILGCRTARDGCELVLFALGHSLCYDWTRKVSRIGIVV